MISYEDSGIGAPEHTCLGPTPASVPAVGPSAELVSELNDLLELCADGVKVSWPSGYDSLTAKAAVDCFFSFLATSTTAP